MVAILLIIASQEEDHIFTNNLKRVVWSCTRYHGEIIISIFHYNGILKAQAVSHRHLHHGHNPLTTDKVRNEVHQPVAGKELAAAHVLHHPADQVGEGCDQLEDHVLKDFAWDVSDVHVLGSVICANQFTWDENMHQEKKNYLW